MRDSTAVCALSTLLKHRMGCVWESGHFVRIFWHGYRPEVVPSLHPWLGSTNQVVAAVSGYRGNAENGLPAPPSGALYLMT